MQVSTSMAGGTNLIRGPMLEQSSVLYPSGREAGEGAFPSLMESAEGQPGEDEAGAGLDDAVRDERDYVRQRLRQELNREPTTEEMDAWLREHTEGY